MQTGPEGLDEVNCGIWLDGVNCGLWHTRLDLKSQKRIERFLIANACDDTLEFTAFDSFTRLLEPLRHGNVLRKLGEAS